jgi:hypothetical protein
MMSVTGATLASPEKGRRFMALSIIGPGFGRTGTASLKIALEQLGFGPCHHMYEVVANPEQVRHWEGVAAGQPIDLDAAFAGYGSQIDWPGAHVWRELAAHHPEAKVVLSVRPEDLWWSSYSSTIGKLLTVFPQLPLPAHISAMMAAARQFIGHDTFGGQWTDRDVAIAAYRKRKQDVTEAIAPERLLVYDVAEGWDPLCAFLNVPVPDTPFPHANRKGEFWEKLGGEPA